MKKKLLGLGVLAVAAGVIPLVGAPVLAYRGDPAVQGPNYSPERHVAMEEAFESRDYEAWKLLMSGRGRVTQVVTQDNFETFARAHELAEEGKIDEAAALRQELGLGHGGGAGCGMNRQAGR